MLFGFLKSYVKLVFHLYYLVDTSWLMIRQWSTPKTFRGNGKHRDEDLVILNEHEMGIYCVLIIVMIVMCCIQGPHKLLNYFIGSYFELEMCHNKTCVKYNTVNVCLEWPQCRQRHLVRKAYISVWQTGCTFSRVYLASAWICEK